MLVRQRLDLFFLGGCLAALLATHSEARNLYVNNLLGDDAFAGEREQPASGAGPVRSINRALRLVLPSDRVVIANTGQPYREQLSISGRCLRGSERNPLVITSDGAVLDGSVIAETGAWRHLQDDVFLLRPRRLAFQQLFRDGKPLDRVRLVSHLDAPQALKPLEWSLVGGALLFRAEENRLPRSYGLRHAGLQTGVTLHNTRHVVIEGLVIQGFQQDGVNAHELVRDCVLRNVQCRANGRSGLCAGGVSRLRAEGCNLYDNGEVQARASGLATLDLVGCDIQQSDDAPATQMQGGKILIDGQPAP